MVKHTQTIRHSNYLSVIDHFVRLTLKGLKKIETTDKIMRGKVI